MVFANILLSAVGSVMLSIAAGDVGSITVETSLAKGPAGKQSAGVEALLVLEPVESDEKLSTPVIQLPVSIPGGDVVGLPTGGKWRVRLQKEGYWSEAQEIDVTSTAGIHLRLLPMGEVRGSFMDSPREIDVRVEFSQALDYRKSSEPEIPRGIVDCRMVHPDLICALPAGRVDFRIQADGFAPIYFWGHEVEVGEILSLGALELIRGGSVAGWVTDEDEQPVEGARLELRPLVPAGADDPVLSLRMSRMRTAKAVTDERGFFQFRGISSGAYHVGASKSGFVPSRTPEPINLQGDVEEVLHDALVLARPLTLEVTLSPPGDPYGQPWRIQAMAIHQERSLPTESGQASQEGGWTRRDLSPAVYYLMVSDSKDERWVAREVELFTDEQIFIDVPLLEVLGTVSFDGQPVPGTIRLTNEEGAGFHFTVDEQGEFSGFLTEEGSWRIRITAGDPPWVLSLDPIVVKRRPGKGVAFLDVEIPNTRLGGDALDSMGLPVAGAKVEVFHRGHRTVSEARTDSQGSFELWGLEPGRKIVSATKGELSSEHAMVSLQEDLTPPRIRLTLRRPTRVSGQVVGSEGQPVVGTRIIAWPDLTSSPGNELIEESTDLDGFFQFSLHSATPWLNMVVMAPGSAVRLMKTTVDPAVPLLITMGRDGGDLTLDLSAAEAEERPDPSSLVLVHEGVLLPQPFWRLVQRTLRRKSPPNRVEFANFETGSYRLCSTSELISSPGLPEHGCTSGYLSPLGALTLKAPLSRPVR